MITFYMNIFLIIFKNTLGIIEDSFKGLVQNGRSECEFRRIKALPEDYPESSKVFNLSSPLEYHYLLAQGPLTEDGMFKFHFKYFQCIVCLTLKLILKTKYLLVVTSKPQYDLI